MPAKQYGVRIDTDLMAWVDAEAKRRGTTRTEFLDHILRSAQAHGVVAQPSPPERRPRVLTSAEIKRDVKPFMKPERKRK